MTEPYYSDATVTLHHGDCLDVLRALPDASVDSVVTDPPYGLEFMGKEWDGADGFRRSMNAADAGRGSVFGRTSRTSPEYRTDSKATAGMMRGGISATDGLPSHMGGLNPKCRTCGKWQRGSNPCRCESPDFPNERLPRLHSFQQWCELWAAECLRVLKPGGHMLAFGGTRTWHRLACAVEDAGFEVRDSIAWLYGSGFPKSLDVSKAIDKAAGAEREVTAVGKAGASSLNNRSRVEQGYRPTVLDGSSFDITTPATPDAETWQGWGTALKPAHEPVLCARKPFNAVPLDWRLVANVHHALAGLLWLSLSPAKRVELSSPSSPAERDGAWCASARVSAATAPSPDGRAETATYSSPATASTSSSIASSWSAILGAISDPTSMSTTSTASSTTIALRTLSSLLGPVTSPTTMPLCECLTRGPSSTAPNAERDSSAAWSNWLHTLSASVPETAIEGIALAVSSALAHSVADLSSGQEAASSARPSATTSAAGSGSPAFEPVVVARKPLVGTVAANVLTHGTGALNIDGCRIEHASEADLATSLAKNPGRSDTFTSDTYGAGRPQQSVNPAGRWPANVVLDESQADALDEQSGESATGKPGAIAYGAHEDTGRNWTYGAGLSSSTPNQPPKGDTGGASRFFYIAKADAAERPRVDGIAHPTVKPLALMRWLVRLVTPPGGTVLEPFAGSGTTVEACIIEHFRCIAIERGAEYLPLIEARIARRRDPVRAIELAGEDMGLFDLDGEAS